MKTDNEFKEWLNSLQVGNYPEVRKKIISECIISEQTFRNWKFGSCKIPPLAQEKINLIAKKQVFTTTNAPEP